MPGPSQYQAADDPRHDLTPWVETPNSTRVSSYRYDHATGELQVRWRNRPPSEGYVYLASLAGHEVPVRLNIVGADLVEVPAAAWRTAPCR